MAGAYCRFCDNRCFVYRVLPDGSWAGHMATCPAGMAHDRKETGCDHHTAINPSLATDTCPECSGVYKVNGGGNFLTHLMAYGGQPCTDTVPAPLG